LEKGQWHLAGCLPYKNLVDALEEFLLRKAPARAHAAQALATQHSPVPDAEALASPSEIRYRGRRRGEQSFAAHHETASAARHARRVTLYEDIHRLRALGLEQHEIGRRLGVSRKTVIRYLQREVSPHRRHWRWRSDRVLDPYEPYLLQRWAEGCHSGRRLWHEIQGQGYAYSFTNVSRLVTRLRREGPPSQIIRSLRGVRRQLAAALTSLHGPSARQVAFLLMRSEQDQQPEEGIYLELLSQTDHEIALASALSTAFLAMVHERCGEHLDNWITEAQTSGIGSLRRFARGLLTDYTAVLAGLTLPVNNGQLEGHINRLKLLKRQMYGRASFELLKQRVLWAG
jgi:transposase